MSVSRGRHRILGQALVVLASLAAILLPGARLVRAQALTNEFPIPTANSRPAGITTGPDGALWFTERGGDKIGRITTAGVITEFPLPTAGSPRGITTGPDGALWFTEALNFNRIG